MQAPGETRTLLWFQRNLRIDDQPLFAGLIGSAVGVWILDPRELSAEDSLGFPRCGDHRLQFLLESVVDLRASLRRLGTDLLVRIGEPEVLLPALADEVDATALRFVREPGTEERAIEKRVLSSVAALGQGVVVDALQPETLFEVEDPFAEARALPEVFSKWRRQCEKNLELMQPINEPSAIPPLSSSVDAGNIPALGELGRGEVHHDPRAVLRFRGGESAGKQRLQEWMFAGDHLKQYKETRNGLLGEAYSSKFSPWLATGCLSSRRVAQQTLAYETQRVTNDSTYWLRFELMWRDYFRLYLLKHGSTLFQAKGPEDIALDWSHDTERFNAWRDGRTGIDFIDANMRELAFTGFMSNRGRQNVASFLSKNLGIDWRWGARWFESCLIDYCPAANWGNWAYSAGVGADPRGFRGFNVISQANRYDPDRAYADLWLSDREGMVKRIVDPERSLAEAESRWQAATR